MASNSFDTGYDSDNTKGLTLFDFRLDLRDGLIEGGEMKILSLGLNWWPGPLVNASINYRPVDLDRSDLNGSSDGLNARITLMLE